MATALVTGSARRIGASLLRYLVNEGYKVVLHYHSSSAEAESLSMELGYENCALVSGDLSQPENAKRVIQESIRAWGSLDLLVNSASVYFKEAITGSGHDGSQQHIWQHTLNVNLTASYELSMAYVNAVDQGHIVNITDAKTRRPRKGFTSYMVSKAGLEMLSSQLALELAPKFRVNAIAPGWIMTAESVDENEAALKELVPLKRQGNSNELCQALDYLLKNNYVTGEILRVDGGLAIV